MVATNPMRLAMAILSLILRLIQSLPKYHRFYFPRTLNVLAFIWNEIELASVSDRLRNALRFIVTSMVDRNLTIRNRFVVNSHNPRGRINGPLANTLYVPGLSVEQNPLEALAYKSKDVISALRSKKRSAIVSNQDLSSVNIPPNSIDYIFIDPPFGHNIMYSELNGLTEAWLRVKSNSIKEALVSEAQEKDVFDYTALMKSCFRKCYEILKPGRWMTVEFHNSQNSIWTAIQEAISQAGFVVADVRTLDKKKGTINQEYYTSGSVKQDLVISAYKPNDGLEDRFKLIAGTEDGVWDFIRTHLNQLPVFVEKNEKVEIVAERQSFLLFDRMVAFHVQRGVTIPISASEFYSGLEQRFPVRDSMYFLAEQVAEYDKKRLTTSGALQLEFFVSDEASAIQWLKQQINRKPQSFQELHPQFLKELGGWHKNEMSLELSTLLEQNFLRYDGSGAVPEQIHAYLSSNWRELRNLSKDAPGLIAKAKDKWYVPDPSKAGDLEKLREKALLKEFEEYKSTKSKLKVFRLEAVRAGFKKAWQDRDYETITKVADKIAKKVLEEDPKLLMWYDQAVTRMGGE
ncbi:DNA methyltransferase [Marinobacter salarius]|uniref:DNA methyltransferase n=1 Tax=Marinobacter salarius TaxID=1420917 RepID=UPI002942AAF9|nr:DNA methyltransferase [Marinobacter salarius]WOI18084.1 DNA methyltransferase [Marinobacter salarius]